MDSQPWKSIGARQGSAVERRITLAYVGSVVPDVAAFRNEAYSPAGNAFQEQLIAGLRGAGLAPSLVLSCRPLAAFPRSRKLVAGRQRAQLSCGTRVVLVPLLNLAVVKQVLVGIWVFVSLLWWGWKNRAAARIVYTYNLTMPPGVFTLLAARCIGARAVASVNDINVPGRGAPSSWPWRLDYALHALLVPRFDGLVVVSRAITRDFAPMVKHVLVEGGLSTDIVAGLESAGDRPPQREFRVVFAGRMKEANGVRMMLQAIARLPENHYRFIFAGDGPLSGEVKTAARGDSRIDYRGFLKVQELLSIYTQAHVLINMRLTKTIETGYFFPSKLMELLASGTPVISTCTGHVEEEFGGLLVPLRDETADGLAQAIHTVEATRPELRCEMGSRARLYMLSHKTWQAQTAKISRFLRNVVGEIAA